MYNSNITYFNCALKLIRVWEVRSSFRQSLFLLSLIEVNDLRRVSNRQKKKEKKKKEIHIFFYSNTHFDIATCFVDANRPIDNGLRKRRNQCLRMWDFFQEVSAMEGDSAP